MPVYVQSRHPGLLRVPIITVLFRLPRWANSYVEALRKAEEAGAEIDVDKAMERILEGLEIEIDPPAARG